MLHLLSKVFLIWCRPNEHPSNTPLMDSLQTFDKYDRDILKVLNFSNDLSLPRSRLYIKISTAGPIPNRSLTGWGTKDGYNGAFPMSLHLITFTLTYSIWFLILEGYLHQIASRMHLVMCIMNTTSFAELVGILYWRLNKWHLGTMKGINRCTPLVRCL